MLHTELQIHVGRSLILSRQYEPALDVLMTTYEDSFACLGRSSSACEDAGCLAWRLLDKALNRQEEAKELRARAVEQGVDTSTWV